jgi:4'-phosphopantetheinyl transferase
LATNNSFAQIELLMSIYHPFRIDFPSEHYLTTSSAVQLSPGEVHIWRIHPTTPPVPFDALSSMLSDDERIRAVNFQFDRDRNYFIVARGLLRVILSKYLNITPSHVEFLYKPYGKPNMLPIEGAIPLQFSLSHSKDLVVYSVTTSCRIGVDIEYMNTLSDYDLLIEQHFSAQEKAAIQRLPEEQQRQAFYSLWTAKEAYLKATGQGLTASLAQIEVGLESDEPSSLRFINQQEFAQWNLTRLNLEPGYAGALVVEDCHNLC